jgi:STE24 endopeptidase
VVESLHSPLYNAPDQKSNRIGLPLAYPQGQPAGIMNSYLLFILTALLGAWLLNLIIAVLELRALQPELPPEFCDVYDEEQYHRSQDYTKAKLRFSQVKDAVMLAATLAFLLSGGFNWLDVTARSAGLGNIGTGLLFTGGLMLLSSLFSLPCAVYFTFVLEERFGFNTTTPKTFVLDLLKGIALAALLGGPLLAAIFWFFETASHAAWLWCWGAVTLFTLLLQFFAPVLLMPLFNKFKPLEEGELRQAVSDYAQAQHFAVQGIYTMDGSKRSAKLNAFFTGFGRFRRIVFFDTLLSKLTIGEIVAVLAHEMGHFKHRHLLKMTAASVLHTGLVLYLLSLLLNNPQLFAAFGMEHVSIYASLVFFSFLYAPAELLLALLFNFFSRRNEYQADAWAAADGKAADLISSLKKLSIHNFSNLTPHPLNVMVNYSHPSVLQRIVALRTRQANFLNR